jgi:dTDP-glucose pyrophosphorylase
MNSQTKAIRWRETILNEAGSVRDAIACLNNSGLQIVLVVSTQDYFVGTITDGDIRRAILEGVTLDQSVGALLNRNAIYVGLEITAEQARKQMSISGVSHLPILNSAMQAIGIHFLNENEITPERKNNFVVMAGGKGARLYPKTKNCPKPMLYVGDRPILHHILDRAISQGFKNFTFATHYLSEMIEEYFGSGEEFGVNISYLREEEPLGTAGALGQLSQHNDLPIIVTNGDLLTDISYEEMLKFHSEHKASATLAVRLHELQNPFGVVETEGYDVVRFEEKPVFRSQTNAGIYVFENDLLKLLTRNARSDMPEFLQKILSSDQKVVAYGVHESWIDIGRPADFDQAQQLNLQSHDAFESRHRG